MGFLIDWQETTEVSDRIPQRFLIGWQLTTKVSHWLVVNYKGVCLTCWQATIKVSHSLAGYHKGFSLADRLIHKGFSLAGWLPQRFLIGWQANT